MYCWRGVGGEGRGFGVNNKVCDKDTVVQVVQNEHWSDARTNVRILKVWSAEHAIIVRALKLVDAV
jgi:hypothetical protein